ncbi:unnamed protein product, partial [Medioppia subpectinata]
VKPTELLLRCGTLLREQPGTDFNISQIISHEKYDDPNYDIALLKVVGEIKLGTSAIDKIALPSQDVDLAPAGAITTVTGWGQNASGYLSEKLQTLDGPVVDRETCINDYKDFDANGVYRISDYMFCAGYDDGKNNSCHGDSGGPLKYKNTLVGVVSWGPGDCTQPHYPSVYTRVGKFRDWIKVHSGI